MDRIVIGTARANVVCHAHGMLRQCERMPADVWNKPSARRRRPIVMIVGQSQSASRPMGKTTMTDIDTQFTQAHEDVQQLPERPGNLTLLRLYALYKQATRGDVQGDKPGFTDIVGKYKYDAWAALKGTAQDTAKQQYVELVEALKRGEAA
jgi:acyl-CoA-binding protein